MQLHTSASYSLTLRCRLENRPGVLGRLTSTIGQAGGNLGAIDIVSVDERQIVRLEHAAQHSAAHAPRGAENGYLQQLAMLPCARRTL